mmetsp:Transcript_16714/g.25149  ORF Transcript_16714/g.25149 Transcript_16714/m.25149 type:complete len:876 (-) Transcript_16714:245-2872(-)
MIKTFIGRRHKAQQSTPSCKDALAYLLQMPPKMKCRVTSRTKLAVGVDADVKGSSLTEEIKKMANEIADEESKTKEENKIYGMIYFNTESGECFQVLEGKPNPMHDAIRHILRDIRHSDLHFQIETKIKRRFRNWGTVYASNTQQWKMVRLMCPNEDEWKRLCANMSTAGQMYTASRDSLVEEVEAKRMVMEYLGPDCKRIWRRRDSICSLTMSTQELGYLRHRHEFAKKKLQGELKKKSSVFSCFEDPDIEEKLEVKRMTPRIKNRSRKGSQSRPSRLSISRSSILDVLRDEETGFIENVEEMQQYIDNLQEGKGAPKSPKKKYTEDKIQRTRRIARLAKETQKVTEKKGGTSTSSPTSFSTDTGATESTTNKVEVKTYIQQEKVEPDKKVIPELNTQEKLEENPGSATIEPPTSPVADDSSLGPITSLESKTTLESNIKQAREEEVEMIKEKTKIIEPELHYLHSDEKRNWELIQAIGPDENAVAGSTNQDDYVTSLQLDPSGNYIAIGDSQGRIGIFDASESKDMLGEDPYQFYEEFVSHHPDFDTLYSRRIPTNIIAVSWLKKQSRSLHVLATNEKTIKLWRLKEIRKDQGQLNIVPVLSKEFEKGHQRFFIHSLSVMSDGETFISADELMLNMWHVERADSHFTLIDDLPEQDDMVEVNRIITSAKADPELCYRFLYTTSVNEVNICDLRARCMQNRPAMILQSTIKANNMSPEVSRELQCITDADFALDNHTVVTRNFSSVRVWDLRKPTGPRMTMTVHEQDPSLFSELCSNGCLVDDFRVGVNRNATGVVTGSYDDYFIAYDMVNNRKKWLQARHAHDFLSAETPRMNEIGRKVLHVDWHDERDIITVASSHSVYVYGLKNEREDRKE